MPITRGRTVKLVQGPEGSPNSSFGLYLVAEPYGCVVFVQSDWDWAGLARNLGWIPCEICGFTDGTVNCAHRKVPDMLSEAFDWLAARDGQEFEDPGYAREET